MAEEKDMVNDQGELENLVGGMKEGLKPLLIFVGVVVAVVAVVSWFVISVVLKAKQE